MKMFAAEFSDEDMAILAASDSSFEGRCSSMARLRATHTQATEGSDRVGLPRADQGHEA